MSKLKFVEISIERVHRSSTITTRDAFIDHVKEQWRDCHTYKNLLVRDMTTLDASFIYKDWQNAIHEDKAFCVGIYTFEDRVKLRLSKNSLNALNEVIRKFAVWLGNTDPLLQHVQEIPND